MGYTGLSAAAMVIIASALASDAGANEAELPAERLPLQLFIGHQKNILGTVHPEAAGEGVRVTDVPFQDSVAAITRRTSPGGKADPAEESMFTLSLYEPAVWLDVSAEPAAHSTTASAPAAFHKGTWDFELTGMHMASVRGKPDRFNAGSLGVGYFVRDNFSLNAAVVGYAVNQPDNGAFAAGLDLYARWYFVTWDRLSLYADTGGGVFMADKEVPEHGTRFNFTPHSGIGVGYRLTDDLYFLFGARFWHLSNAGIHGDLRNPSFDGVQYYGSLMIMF